MILFLQIRYFRDFNVKSNSFFRSVQHIDNNGSFNSALDNSPRGVEDAPSKNHPHGTDTPETLLPLPQLSSRGLSDC